jgi:ElaB/YqjD/DUF883 family membrane-anchored ribosome-binding protein
MARRRKASRSGIETIQDELVSIGAEVSDLGSSLGAVASDEARETIRSIRARLDRIADTAGSSARAGVELVHDRIEENPLTSIAIALGVGVVIASLLRR